MDVVCNNVLVVSIVVTEPLVLAELSSSFSTVEQGRFSGAYQSIKGLTRIASPFLVMVLFNQVWTAMIVKRMDSSFDHGQVQYFTEFL